MGKCISHKGSVSIIIPCYNQGDTLGETLESVESARSPNLREVIIVNDGSTEPRTLRQFVELKKYNYTLICQPNMGLANARNTGIRASTGKFILPLDSDNLIRSAYLDSAVDILEANPELGVVYGNAQYFGEQDGPWNVADFDLARLAGGNYIDACALIRRTAFDEIGGYDERMPHMGWEDWDLWLRLGSRDWGFHHLDEVAFDYRVRSGSMIGETNKHSDELLKYIFHKPGNLSLRLLREKYFELESSYHKLARIEGSKAYRIERKLKKLFRVI